MRKERDRLLAYLERERREALGGGGIFAWLTQNRRMSKDYERMCRTSKSFVYAAMARLMVKRLARV
jgi:hypothetical protein